MFSLAFETSGGADMTSCVPPLQYEARLMRSLTSGTATEEDVEAVRAYLGGRCANSAVIAQLREHIPKEKEMVVFGSGGAAATAQSVAARAASVLSEATTQAENELQTARLVATESSAQEEQLASSSAARLGRLTSTEASGGLLATTMTLAGTLSGTPRELALRTHRLAAKTVAPFLTRMRAHAAVGSASDVIIDAADGAAFLKEVLPERSECFIFGTLEIYRHLTLHLFGLCSAADVVQQLGAGRVREEIHLVIREGVVPFEKQLRDDVAELRAQRQQTDQITNCVSCITQLVQDYCIFFHLTFAVADGLSKHFYRCAAALHPAGGGLYGTTRFPRARPCILYTNGSGDGRAKAGRNAIDGRPLEVPCPAFSPEVRSHDKVMPTATADRVTTVSSVLSLVVAPSSHIAAFLLLSAIGTLPLSAALEVAVTAAEIQELYADTPLLMKLVKAMWRGHLGEVLTFSQRAADELLAGGREPLVSDYVVASLRAEVTQSLCYQYASSRAVVDLAAAARYFGLDDASVLLRVLEPLIASGSLSMRVNTVDQRLTQIAPPSLTDPRTVGERTLEHSRIALMKTEQSLRRLSVERTLVKPTAACVPSAQTRFWPEGALPAQATSDPGHFSFPAANRRNAA